MVFLHVVIKFQLVGIPRVGATLAVALKNRGFVLAAKGDRKGRPYACISNSPLNSKLLLFQRLDQRFFFVLHSLIQHLLQKKLQRLADGRAAVA